MKCDKCGYDDYGTGDSAHFCMDKQMSEHKIVVDNFNPAPSDDYATLRRQFSALVTVIRGNNAQFASYDSKFRELRHEASLSNKQEIDSLRKTNEYLTNMIDADLQSENERLRAQVEALVAVNQALMETLGKLTGVCRREFNSKRVGDWATLHKAEQLLKEGK